MLNNGALYPIYVTEKVDYVGEIIHGRQGL